jgi:hypothetical protein
VAIVGFLFIGAVAGILGLTALVTGIFVCKGEKTFRAQAESTTGTVVGYVRVGNTFSDIPQLELTIDGKSVICRSKSKRMTPQTHPHGTKVKVLLRTKAMFGGVVNDVRVDEDGFRSAPNTVPSGIFIAVAVVLFAFGGVMAAMSLRYLL